MNKIKASAYIICQNEEKHIQRVLESVKDFDEIIIVDSGSTDKTLEIAKEYTDKIYHQEWLGYSGQKEYAKNLCTNEWVLNLDADEEL
ncbi:MAG: glycosyltransferase family 2 protein, partial [Arcobacter sp.]|nr:glycosyltransferase family 2 protein [Arcobacter sp.]